MEIIFQFATFIFHFNSISSVNSHLHVFCGIGKKQKNGLGKAYMTCPTFAKPFNVESGIAVTVPIWAT